MKMVSRYEYKSISRDTLDENENRVMSIVEGWISGGSKEVEHIHLWIELRKLEELGRIRFHIDAKLSDIFQAITHMDSPPDPVDYSDQILSIASSLKEIETNTIPKKRKH